MLPEAAGRGSIFKPEVYTVTCILTILSLVYINVFHGSLGYMQMHNITNKILRLRTSK